MTSFYQAGAVAAVLSVVFTYLFSRYAQTHQKFMPDIRDRDVHKSPVPRVGGIAIVLSFLITVLFWNYFHSEAFNFSNRIVLGLDQNLLGLLLGVAVLAVVNVIDDYKEVHWGFKLAAQIIAALLIAYFGIKIQWLSSPDGSQILLGSLDWLFVVIWLTGLSNVTNWLDGINGLAGGVAAIGLAIIMMLSLNQVVSQQENALVAAIGLGAVIGFLPFNLVRAKAFLGDTGSVFLGFLIGVLAIISGGKIATAFLVLAVPFIDAIFVFFSRIAHKQSPFKADNRHLHHRLLAIGMKPWQIVLSFYALSLFFGLVALNTQTIGKFWTILVALVLMVLLVLLFKFREISSGKINSNGEE